MKKFIVFEFYQETNSFNPQIMDWHKFESCSVSWGPVMAENASPDSGIAGMRAALDGYSGDRTAPKYLGSMNGLCGGRVADHVIHGFWDRIVEAIQGLETRIDGALLLLHGACASESLDDVEGWMIGGLRGLLGGVPIVVGFDHHANITRDIMRHADAIVGYQTEPHYPFETGYNATNLLLSMLNDGLRPAMSWRKIPMISPQDQFETAAGPMKNLFDLAREAEQVAGVLSVSPFPMQPWLDVLEGGWSVVVVTDGSVDPDPVAARIAGIAWDTRELFWRTSGVPIDLALSSSPPETGLVVVHDTGDSVFAGSSGDSVALLEALLREPNAPGIISIVAPDAVSRAYDARPESSIDVTLGGGPVGGTTVNLKVKVKGLSQGPVWFEPFYGLTSVDEGRTALLGVGAHLINVTENSVFGGNDPALYERYGVELESVRYAVVKVAADYNRFGRWRTDKVRVNSPGCSQYELKSLPWSRLPRPIFGLDEGVEWHALTAARGIP